MPAVPAVLFVQLRLIVGTTPPTALVDEVWEKCRERAFAGKSWLCRDRREGLDDMEMLSEHEETGDSGPSMDM